MKNRFPALVLAGALSLSLLAGCGGAPAETPGASPEISPLPQESMDVMDPTETPMPEESETPADTAAPTEGAAASDEPSAAPSARPTAKPSTAPSAAPTAKPAPSAKPSQPPAAESDKVQDIWNAVSKLDLPSMEGVGDDMLKDMCGVDPADLTSYVYKIPFMNVQATEVFIAKVKSGKMDAVKSALQDRQAALEDQWSHYLPEQYELVKNYKLVSSGDYVMFIVSYDADKAVESFNSYTK